LHTIHGQIIRQSGDILRAIEEFQRGRDEGKTEGDARGAAICLSEIGITWERAGEGDRGARVLSQAAEEAEACGEMQMATRWRGMAVVDAEGRRSVRGFDGLAFIAARVRAATGPPDEEVVTIAKEIIIEARGTNQGLESMARNALAGLYALRGQFNQAITQLTVAIQIADSTHDEWSGMMFRANLANISFRAKRMMIALRSLVSAASILEDRVKLAHRFWIL
jgi:tetratricopeptide (TPR) repeat protein